MLSGVNSHTRPLWDKMTPYGDIFVVIAPSIDKNLLGARVGLCKRRYCFAGRLARIIGDRSIQMRSDTILEMHMTTDRGCLHQYDLNWKLNAIGGINIYFIIVYYLFFFRLFY